MVKFLIATHGHLADGFKDTLGIIMGEEITKRVETFNLFVEDEQNSEDANTRIRNYFYDLKKGEQSIVFTDILHGSVNQFMMPYANDHTIFIITGVNLPAGNVAHLCSGPKWEEPSRRKVNCTIYRSSKL